MAAVKKGQRKSPTPKSIPGEAGIRAALEQLHGQVHGQGALMEKMHGRMEQMHGQMHGQGVLIEQMHGQNRATIEAVQSLEQKMDRRFAKSDEKNERRFTVLEAAVRQNSADIRQNSADIRQNSADIVGIKEELQGVNQAILGLTRRVDRIEEVLKLKLDGPPTADLEARIRRIEMQLGLTNA